MIRIECTAFEVNRPEYGNYLYCRAEVEDQGFRGWCECVFSEASWDGFVRDLTAFARGAASAVSVQTGWGDEVYFRLRFEPPDKRGHVWVTGEVGMPARSRVPLNPPLSHKLHFSCEIDLASLDEFACRCAGMNRAGATAELP